MQFALQAKPNKQTKQISATYVHLVFTFTKYPCIAHSPSLADLISKTNTFLACFGVVVYLFPDNVENSFFPPAF